ncbi:MAG: methyltransferase domain-containing protein [Pseudomonadota bacterium]
MTATHGRQVWNAGDYDANARFVSDLAGAVIEWLAPQAGERILDLGCGDGALTEQLVSAGCDVVGVDSSQNFVTACKERGLDARLMDGQALEFEGEFDAVFSNAALHWMTDPEAVIGGARRALKPGGRFVAEFGGHGNVAAIVTAMRAVALSRGADPASAYRWYFPTPAEYGGLLSAAGFDVARIDLYPRPTPLKTGIEAWLKLFSLPFFEQFGEECDVAVKQTAELLAPSLRDDSGNWTADYVRLRVEARLA